MFGYVFQQHCCAEEPKSSWLFQVPASACDAVDGLYGAICVKLEDLVHLFSPSQS